MGTKANRAARNKAARGDSASLGKSVLRWVIDIAIAVLIAYLITLVVRPTIVVETSMLPNFKQNDYLFIYKLAYAEDNSILSIPLAKNLSYSFFFPSPAPPLFKSHFEYSIWNSLSQTYVWIAP